jgi:hypothetical protein
MNKRTKIIFTILVAIHLILIILTLTGKLNFLFNDASLRKGKAADFFAVYQAGDNILDGESVYLDTEGESTPYSFPFRYLPFLGYTIGIVVNLLPHFTAYYVLIFFYEILLGVNVYLTYRLCKNKVIFPLASLPWLLFSPYLIEIFMGQWTFLLTCLLFYTMYALIQNTRYIYLYILSPIIKPNALILAPLLFRLRKYKLLILTVLGILITSIPYFIIFKDDLSVFLENFQDSWYSHGGNFGFKSLYYLVAIKYLSIPLPRLWFMGIAGAMGLITLFLTFKYKNKVLIFALWICYYFLIYKDVWEHHYVLLMPVFALLFSQAEKFKQFCPLATCKLKSKYRANILLVISLILIAIPSIFALQYLFQTDAPVEPDELSALFVIPYHSLKIIGIVCLFIWSSLNLKIGKKV